MTSRVHLPVFDVLTIFWIWLPRLCWTDFGVQEVTMMKKTSPRVSVIQRLKRWKMISMTRTTMMIARWWKVVGLAMFGQLPTCSTRWAFELGCLQKLNLTLFQLRQFTNGITNSSTKLRPAWEETLRELNLPQRILRRDVATRWNSTFDMLDDCLHYRYAIDAMTANRLNKLRHLEMDTKEWLLAIQLLEILNVCYHWLVACCFSPVHIDLQRRDSLFFKGHSKPVIGHSCYGSYRWVSSQ